MVPAWLLTCSPLRSIQQVLSEEEIDASFKTLFRQLAGEVGWVGWGEGLWGSGGQSFPRVGGAILCLPPGHGDQRQGAADHSEQDHQQT